MHPRSGLLRAYTKQIHPVANPSNWQGEAP
jgi:hypothetical protein